MWLSLLVATLLLPAVVDCFASEAASAQTMPCCGESNCAPGHENKACISTTLPTDASQPVPEMRVSIPAPVVGALSHAEDDLDATVFKWIAFPNLIRHSPPDLYTLHLAFLI
jgi:hypothetical protein